jgi:outer membrane protein TolC
MMLGALVLAATFANLPLSAAQASAVGNSPEVLAATERVNENKAMLAAARGTFGPALSANYSQSPQAGATGGTIAQKLTTVGAQMTLGDLLNYSPAVAQASANLRSAQFDLLAVQRMENIRLIALYYDALRGVATAQTRNDALEAAQADLRAAEIRFKAGDAPHLDVVRAEVTVARAMADLETAKATQSNALEALAIETGTAAPALGPVLDTSPATGSPLPLTAVDAVKKALGARPELASAQAAVDAEAAAVRSAERGVLPAISLAAGTRTERIQAYRFRERVQTCSLYCRFRTEHLRAPQQSVPASPKRRHVCSCFAVKSASKLRLPCARMKPTAGPSWLRMKRAVRPKPN